MPIVSWQRFLQTPPFCRWSFEISTILIQLIIHMYYYIQLIIHNYVYTYTYVYVHFHSCTLHPAQPCALRVFPLSWQGGFSPGFQSLNYRSVQTSRHHGTRVWLELSLSVDYWSLIISSYHWSSSCQITSSLSSHCLFDANLLIKSATKLSCW